ncbi:LapA family protein [Candidatus Neomarinimicrobiota bacterium]
MRLLKILITLFGILALAFLLSKNSDQQVHVWLYPGKVLEELSLATLMIGTIAIGIILGFAIALLQIMGQQVTLADQNKQLKKLRTEINNLRHSGLEDVPLDKDSDAADEVAAIATDKPLELGG